MQTRSAQVALLQLQIHLLRLRAAERNLKPWWKRWLPRPVKKFWVAETDTECIECIETEDMNKEGRKLLEMFDTTRGPRTGPKLHAHCKCRIENRRVDE